MSTGATPAAPEAAALDRADPLAAFTERFAPAPGVVAYLDGNSLGRPVDTTGARLAGFAAGEWGERLIRSGEERWMDLPTALGDRLGAAVLGAEPGQTVVADSTSVLLYKLLRAGVAARPERRTILASSSDFPTDRFLVDAVAEETGRRVRRLETAAEGGVGLAQLEAAIDGDTALVVLSHVDYRSGWIADAAAITRLAHERGALVLWDLSHSAGAVPLELDDWGVDLAAGCGYKYLNGGPGAPAFAYVRRELHPAIEQPIRGWMGAADVFAMAERHRPAVGIRRLLSGTPPVLAMVPMQQMLELIEEAGIAAVRAKSQALTAYAVAWSDEHLAPLGVKLGSPREPDRRGGHVTLRHPAFRAATPLLWARGVIPDFRDPDGLRLGLSPLSTSFAELERGLVEVRAVLRELV